MELRKFYFQWISALMPVRCLVNIIQSMVTVLILLYFLCFKQKKISGIKARRKPVTFKTSSSYIRTNIRRMIRKKNPRLSDAWWNHSYQVAWWIGLTEFGIWYMKNNKKYYTCTLQLMCKLGRTADLLLILDFIYHLPKMTLWILCFFLYNDNFLYYNNYNRPSIYTCSA